MNYIQFMADKKTSRREHNFHFFLLRNIFYVEERQRQIDENYSRLETILKQRWKNKAINNN